MFKFCNFFEHQPYNVHLSTELPTKDETVKTTWNTLDMTIHGSFMCIALILNFNWFILLFSKERNQFTVAGNHEYKKTESIDFVVVSRLSSHHLYTCNTNHVNLKPWETKKGEILVKYTGLFLQYFLKKRYYWNKDTKLFGRLTK